MILTISVSYAFIDGLIATFTAGKVFYLLLFFDWQMFLLRQREEREEMALDC